MGNEAIDKYLRGEKIINKVTNCDFSSDITSWGLEGGKRSYPKPLFYDQSDYGFFNGSLGDYGVITIMAKDYKKLIKNQIENRLPKQVQFNDKKKATTLIFKENVIVVKAREDDKYDRRIGFLEAYFQATSGMSKTKALKYLNDIVKDKVTANKKEKTHLLKEEKK